MTVEATANTMRSYLDALLARGNFADYYTDEVTWTAVGADQDLQGRQPVRDSLSGCIPRPSTPTQRSRP
jgi:hypothetical protein